MCATICWCDYLSNITLTPFNACQVEAHCLFRVFYFEITPYHYRKSKPRDKQDADYSKALKVLRAELDELKKFIEEDLDALYKEINGDEMHKEEIKGEEEGEDEFEDESAVAVAEN